MKNPEERKYKFRRTVENGAFERGSFSDEIIYLSKEQKTSK
jgi:hypothetical protein